MTPTRDHASPMRQLGATQPREAGPALTHGAFRAVRRFGQLLIGLLREIADENAYHRHLAIHGLQHSGAEWRRFCDERWLAASKRAKCC